MQLANLQLRHKSHFSEIDPQNRDLILRRQLCRVQDGAVSAKADQKLGRFHGVLQIEKLDIFGILYVLVNAKRQADPALDADAV